MCTVKLKSLYECQYKIIVKCYVVLFMTWNLNSFIIFLTHFENTKILIYADDSKIYSIIKDIYDWTNCSELIIFKVSIIYIPIFDQQKK